MLPSNMHLNIRWGTAGYNSKIIVSDSGFNLGKKDTVNTSVPEKSSHKTSSIPNHAQETSIVPKHTHKEVPCSSAITHEEERSHWYSFKLMPLEYGILFNDEGYQTR